MVPSRHVDDLTQDVLATAVATADRFRSALGRPERWLNRMAVFAAAHHLARAEWKREELTADPPDAADSRPTADLVLESEDELLAMRQAVFEAIAALPDGMRHVVEAHDLKGESMVDIAARLGAPLSTTYKWRVRALALLGRTLRTEDR